MTSRPDILDPLPLVGSSCSTLPPLKLLIENFLGAEVLHEQNYIPELGSDDGIFKSCGWILSIFNFSIRNDHVVDGHQKSS